MIIARLLPCMLLGPVSGVFADRWDRKTMMIVMDVARALALCCLFGVKSADSVWIVYLAGTLEATFTTFFSPARNSLLPNLVDKDGLLQANSLFEFSGSVVMLAGPAIGGALYAIWGFKTSILLDILSFLFSAVMISLITRKKQITDEQAPEQTPKRKKIMSIKEVKEDFIEGLNIIKGNRIIMILFIALSFIMIGNGFSQVFFIPFIKDIVKGTSKELGWILSSIGAGSLISSFIVGGFIKNRLKTEDLIKFGLLLNVLFFFLAFNYSLLPFISGFDVTVIFICIMFALLGGSGVLFSIGIQTLLQRNTQDESRGRVFGVRVSVNSVAMSIGLGLSSLFGNKLGILPMINIGVGLDLIALILCVFLLRNTEKSA
jgi:predicted MFS family arabinose efflux permease